MKSPGRDNTGCQISRRQFFKTSGLLTAGLLSGSCSRGPNQPETMQESVLKKTGIAPAVNHAYEDPLVQVAQATLYNYDPVQLKATIQSSLEAIGGIADIVKTGDTVGIKLNMTGGQGYAANCVAQYGFDAVELYWTHPGILEAVGELLIDAGAGRIIVMEAVYDMASYTNWGYRDAVIRLGAEFADLNNPAPYGDFLNIEVPDPMTHWGLYYHHGLLHELDCFVTLPKIKRHSGGGMTGALKNMIGSVPLSLYQKSQAWREKLHCNDDLQNANSYEGCSNLVRTIVELNQIRPAHLSVCDAIRTADNGEGPWNTGFQPLALNTLITSKDPVAADAIGTTLFGHDPGAADREGPFASSSLPGNFAGTDNYLRIAEERQLGIHRPEVIGLVDATVSTYVES